MTYRMIYLCMAASAMLMAAAPLMAFDLRLADPAQAAKLSDAVILDARPPKEWQQGHIPGALSFSWENYTRTEEDGVKWRILPPEELARALGAMGISHTDAVLVYGDADTSWGGEGWVVWMLAWLGHEGPIYFLDGGIQSWQADNRPMTADAGKNRAPTTYEVNLAPQVNISREQIDARKDEINLVDTRGFFKEWMLGRLPGAVHLGWEKFYQGRHRQVISADQLKTLLEDKGVDLNKPVVYYCTAGIRSGYTWLVHQLSGLPGAVNYEGGTEEWSQKHPLTR